MQTIIETAKILEAADPNRAHLEFDRLRRLATLRHYQVQKQMLDAENARRAEQAKAAAHYGALAQEAAK